MPKPRTADTDSKVYTFQFGKYAGQSIHDVPQDYLEWLKNKAEEDIVRIDRELMRREDIEKASQSTVEKLVAEGFRSLAKKLHPDHGGTAEQFRDLQAARERLNVILREIK